MSDNLSMLVMEMIRNRRAERESQKDRAYDMWKLRESQEYNDKITRETREYNKSHELFVISKENEKSAEAELLKVQFEAEKLGVNLDTVDELYQSDDSISKLMNELVQPQVQNYENLSEYYEKEAEIHKKKRDVLAEIVFSDLNKAQQIMVGAGGRGRGDSTVWDKEDISLDAYIDMYAGRPLDDISVDIASSLGQAIYGEDVTDTQIASVMDAYRTATDKDATYTDTSGAQVKVGEQPINVVMSAILEQDVPEEFDPQALISAVPTTDFDPATDPRDEIVAEFFSEKAGQANVELEKLIKGDVDRDYKIATTKLTEKKTSREELAIQEWYADQSRKKLAVYAKIAENNMKLDDIYENQFSLTVEGGYNQLVETDEGVEKAKSILKDVETDRIALATSFLMATDYAEWERLMAVTDEELRKRLVSEAMTKFESMLEYTEGDSAVRQGVLMDADFTQFYNYFTEAIENYKNAEPAEKFQVMQSILKVFGAPANIQGEEEMFNWYQEWVDVYSVILGSDIQGGGANIQSVHADPIDEDAEFDFTGYPNYQKDED